MLATYDSMGKFASAVERVWADPKHKKQLGCLEHDRQPRNSWHGNLEGKTALKKCRFGDESLATAAQTMLEKLDATLPMTLGVERVRSPFGGRVNYGDWYAGSPTPMRRRVKRQSDLAPIKIVVSVTCSASLGTEELKARGSAILAFVLRAQMIRPVELYILACETHNSGDGWEYHLVKVDSKPIALGQAAFGLVHPAMPRQLGYTLADQNGFDGSWPTDYNNGNYAQRRRDRLGLSESDIHIKEAHINDELIRNPEAWIKRELVKLANESEEI